MITASHNSKEYNGYKAYWNDGAQVVPRTIKYYPRGERDYLWAVKFDADKSKIHTIGPEVEQAYHAEVKKIIPNQDKIKGSITFHWCTPFTVRVSPWFRNAWKQIGFTNIQVVDEQKHPMVISPTVASPNPEERSAMEMVIAKGKAVGATMVMATDPDTDRVGIGVRNAQNEFILLNGNQAFSLMMWFIMKSLKDRSNAYIAKTIVTSELVDLMAKEL